MVWQFGSYNNGYCNFEPTFRFDTENSSFGYKFCDFDIKIYEESGLCHAKIDIYLSSYCDWETCFQVAILEEQVVQNAQLQKENYLQRKS